MRIRNVNTQLYNRVINWIEYQWIWGRRLNEDEKVSKLLYMYLVLGCRQILVGIGKKYSQILITIFDGDSNTLQTLI